jgi:hypothetical protein
VNDGSPHAVTITRTSGTLTATVDGVAAGGAASTSNLGALPAMRIGSDICTERDGTIPLAGALTDVCLSR